MIFYWCFTRFFIYDRLSGEVRESAPWLPDQPGSWAVFPDALLQGHPFQHANGKNDSHNYHLVVIVIPSGSYSYSYTSHITSYTIWLYLIPPLKIKEHSTTALKKITQKCLPNLQCGFSESCQNPETVCLIPLTHVQSPNWKRRCVSSGDTPRYGYIPKGSTAKHPVTLSLGRKPPFPDVKKENILESWTLLCFNRLKHIYCSFSSGVQSSCYCYKRSH